MSELAEKIDREKWRQGQIHTAAPIVESFEDCLSRVTELAESRKAYRASLEEWLGTQPQSVICFDHSRERVIDFDESSRLSQLAQASTSSIGKPIAASYRVIYKPCPKCLTEGQGRERGIYWAGRGIEAKYIGATLDQLSYDTAEGETHLQTAKAFAASPKGWLVIIGNPGTGKTHIGTAILQKNGRGFFITQSKLLADHRRTYREDAAIDIRKRCQTTSLLALDDIGVSVGGKDEGPLLFDILNHRYNVKAPTILTSNLPEEEFWKSLGTRLVDRAREATYAVLRFEEQSKRGLANQRYLKDL